jgi:hypothetical protein
MAQTKESQVTDSTQLFFKRALTQSDDDSLNLTVLAAFIYLFPKG